MSMTTALIDEYSALAGEIGKGTPTFDELELFVLQTLFQAGNTKPMLLTFDGFEEFFDWLDTATHYDQEDNEQDLSEHRGLLELVYIYLLAQALEESEPVKTEVYPLRTTFAISLSPSDFATVRDCPLQFSSAYIHEQMDKMFRHPRIDWRGTELQYTLDAEEDTPPNHAAVLNLVRAQILKARALHSTMP